MSWKAEEIQAALEMALEDYAGAEQPIYVRVDDPEPEEAPGSFFVIVRTGDAQVQTRLPVALASAYLADEEAAVDEFKRWMRELLARLPPPRPLHG